jgi:hypothetical protein
MLTQALELEGVRFVGAVRGVLIYGRQRLRRDRSPEKREYRIQKTEYRRQNTEVRTPVNGNPPTPEPRASAPSAPRNGVNLGPATAARDRIFRSLPGILLLPLPVPEKLPIHSDLDRITFRVRHRFDILGEIERTPLESLKSKIDCR